MMFSGEGQVAHPGGCGGGGPAGSGTCGVVVFVCGSERGRGHDKLGTGIPTGWPSGAGGLRGGRAGASGKSAEGRPSPAEAGTFQRRFSTFDRLDPVMLPNPLSSWVGPPPNRRNAVT